MKAHDACVFDRPSPGLRPALSAGPCSMSRRHWLVGLAATAALPAGAITLPPSAVAGRRVDMHHHFFPPALVSQWAARGVADPAAGAWSPARSLDDMAQGGVATAMLALPAPAVSFLSGEPARRLAREANEHAARLAGEYPGRFGWFATVPLPDVDASLQEIAYALDTLKADGVALLSSYGDRWLGHPAFGPLMDELHRRKAVVYVHPTVPDCCRHLLPGTPPGVVEYGADITRTIVSIVFSGTAARCHDIRFVFSHAGGTLPFVVEQLLRMPAADAKLAERVPDGVLHELTRFYYDTAGAAHPGALASLMRLVSVRQVVFGSDYPYRNAAEHVAGLTDHGFRESELFIICYDNARRLLPRIPAP
jgi:predicted TIM-barrel fold metal-dependent hydrolase